MANDSGDVFPLEELMARAPDSAKEAFVERSAAFEAGDLVRMMRENAHMTQKELAQKISTSQSHLSEVERGNGLQGPTFSLLRKVADVCQVALKIEISDDAVLSKFSEAKREQRDAIAKGLGVRPEDVSTAFLAARTRASSVLSASFIDEILQGQQSSMSYNYAKWLESAGKF